MKCPRPFPRVQKGGLEMHAHLSFMVYANCTQVTETGTWSRVKAKWSILPRPRECFLWCGRSLCLSQGPGVTYGGMRSASCMEAWALTPVTSSPDTAIEPTLTPLSATCLLCTLPVQGCSATKECFWQPLAVRVQGKGSRKNNGKL